MTRFLLVLLALWMLGTAPRAAAACRWFGTQLECDLGGSQMVIGTQVAPEPAYAEPLRSQPFQGSSVVLGDRVATEWPFRLEIQNFGADPTLCRKFGNENYCY